MKKFTRNDASLAWVALVALMSMSCKKSSDATQEQPDPKPEGAAKHEPERPTGKEEMDHGTKPEVPDHPTDSEISDIRLNLDEHEFGPVPSLPPGAEMVLVEGKPPFDGTSFLFVLKFPKGYQIPPHTHLVTERVTVLKGTLHFGMGEKVDKKKGKKLDAGAIVLIPAGHVHHVWTTEETYVQLQGVGPWGIYYVNPKDDPRQPPPEKPEPPAATTDSPIEAAHLNPSDVAWSGPVGSLPPGAEMAVLEGSPPFAENSFVFRLKFPDGYRIPPHYHPSTERVTVLSGSIRFGMGETWDDDSMKTLEPGGLGIMPAGHNHFVEAVGETVVQLQGVGPWGITYVNPEDDPRNK